MFSVCRESLRRSNKIQFSLKGNTAVITGGARGLGFAFAEALAEVGSNIAILDIGTPQAGALEALARKYSVKVEAYKVDVSFREQVRISVVSMSRELSR